MVQVAHTLPLLISDEEDLNMLMHCLSSLAASNPGGLLVVYNQGTVDNQDLVKIMERFHLHSIILGSGENIGIPRGRQTCFEYIWRNFPEAAFISEIHTDMIFPPKWIQVLAGYLQTHDEPMICPGILTSQGELHPEYRNAVHPADIPREDSAQMNTLLESLAHPGVIKGFVHPVLHQAQTLQAVGGYDTRLLTGLQEYEDDSLLLGYRYYMGLRHNWLPKCCTEIRVYHATMVQRSKIPYDPSENFWGLVKKYGLEGMKQLSVIYPDSEWFKEINRLL